MTPYPPSSTSTGAAQAPASERATAESTETSQPSSPADADVPVHIRRLRTTRAVLWAIVGAMTVGWLFYAGGLDSLTSTFRPPATPAITADVGQPAPDLRLPLAGGGEVSLGQYRGQVVLVNFWATWCEPCRSEMPVFERAHQTYGSQGLVVLGVDVQERDPDVLAFMREVGVTFPSAIDANGEATRAWRAVGLPTTFLIDREGIIRDVRVGPFTDDMLSERLNRLLRT